MPNSIAIAKNGKFLMVPNRTILDFTGYLQNGWKEETKVPQEVKDAQDPVLRIGKPQDESEKVIKEAQDFKPATGPAPDAFPVIETNSADESERIIEAVTEGGAAKEEVKEKKKPGPKPSK